MIFLVNPNSIVTMSCNIYDPPCTQLCTSLGGGCRDRGTEEHPQ